MYDRMRPEMPPEEANEYDPSIASDPVPEEPPVLKDEGEPLEEDRVVPFQKDHEVAVVDGVTMNLDCNLKTLQAGCTSLGLSGRGGKAKCLKRMVDHLRAQALIAAHGATVKLRSEDQRHAQGKSKPEEPSQQDLENHALTHEPFKDWCHLCVQYRSRQENTSSVTTQAAAIQFFLWILVFAAEWKMKVTSKHAFACLTGPQKYGSCSHTSEGRTCSSTSCDRPHVLP